MINRDRRCVHVVTEAVLGEVLVNWLGTHGIASEVMDGGTNGGFEGVTWMVPGPSYKGIEVWVLDPADIERAISLLAEKATEVAALATARQARTGEIEARCEECGRSSFFPSARAGRTESCLHCHAYLDVPDPDAPEDDEFWRAGGEIETAEE